MRHRTKIAAAVAALALTASSLAMSNSAAQAQPGRVLYNPGSANSFTPTYDSALGGYWFKCSYAGWVSVTVDWSCDFTAPALGLQLSHKTGSFSNGSANPGPWFYPKQYGTTTVCAVAWAGYANGSSQNSSQKCV